MNATVSLHADLHSALPTATVDNKTGELNSESVNTTEDTTNITVKFLPNVTAIGISSVNTILTIMAVIILYKCKRMPFQIKRLSYNIFLTDLILNIVLVLMSVSMISFIEEHLLVLRTLRICCVATSIIVSLGSVAALTLDRLVALTKPYTYTTLLSERNVTIITLYVWLANTIVPITAFVISIGISCNFDILHCVTLNLPFRAVVAVFYVLYHSFIIYAYIVITKITRNHIRSISQQTQITREASREKHKPDFTATNTIAKIVLIFELTNFPIFVHTLFFIMFPFMQTESSITVFQSASYLFYCGNLYICFYLYVWRMKECRLVFLSTFLYWNKTCMDAAEKLKVEVYDTSEQRSSVSTKPSKF